MDLRDRQRATLLGLAIGDALGAAVEFQPPGSFEPVTDFRGGGPHGLDAGEWTDDTSMALAMADSISEVGWDLDDQAQRYLAWRRQGEYSVNGHCFDIGLTVGQALSRFEETGDARTSGDRSEHSSGNGSIMRLAPVPIRYSYLFPDNLETLVERACESSLPTHGSQQCVSACSYLTIVICGLIHVLPPEDVLMPDWKPVRWLRENIPLHPEIEAVTVGSFQTKAPPELQGSGYVVRAESSGRRVPCDTSETP